MDTLRVHSHVLGSRCIPCAERTLGNEASPWKTYASLAFAPPPTSQTRKTGHFCRRFFHTFNIVTETLPRSILKPMLLSFPFFSFPFRRIFPSESLILVLEFSPLNDHNLLIGRASRILKTRLVSFRFDSIRFDSIGTFPPSGVFWSVKRP